MANINVGKNVTVIPARKRVGNTVSTENIPKLRVAAYCRVSTDTDEQATSYDAQVEHYTDFIRKNTEWEFAGIFADDGISGTNTKKRDEFNRMIDECMAGNIDMIITKSISRFARNTLDCLKYIRDLKAKNIPVYFEKENINTMDAKGEVLLTIMASLAQQESQSLSQNVKLGLQYRYQQGKVQVNHNRFLGYTKDEDGNLIIEPKGAKVVKRIFREYLEGESLAGICKGLMRDGIYTAAGNPKWRPETVQKILQNEKYIGDALLQKTYTVDFLTKKRVKNEGIVPQYYVENNHEAIIPRELYLQVQEEMKRRSLLFKGKDGRKRIYSSKYALSSITFCSDCGDIYRRTYWNNRGKKSTVWRCVTRLEEGPKGCTSRTISEEDLHDAVAEAFNQVLSGGESIIAILRENIESVVCESNEQAIANIDKQMEEKQMELISYANSGKDYESLADEIQALSERKQTILTEEAESQGEKDRITEMMEFIENHADKILGYDEELVRLLVEKATIFENNLVVRFKSGIEVEI